MFLCGASHNTKTLDQGEHGPPTYSSCLIGSLAPEYMYSYSLTMLR